MVRQWQTLFYNERYSNTHLHSHSVPDFVKLAEAYGCYGLRCESPEQVDAFIADVIRPIRQRYADELNQSVDELRV